MRHGSSYVPLLSNELEQRLLSPSSSIGDDDRHSAGSDIHSSLSSASGALDPRNIPLRFLRRYGHDGYDWSLARSYSAVPFSNCGFSEATMFHCILELDQEAESLPLHVSVNDMVTASKKSSHLLSPKTSQLYRADSFDEGSEKLSKPPSPMARFMNRFLPRSKGAGRRPNKKTPPAVFVLKHYDTALVESVGMIIRWARRSIHITAEDMYRHEVSFYVLVRPFVEHLRCFKTPEPLFVSVLDRGNPGWIRYVCCKQGSGSFATIGMEDVTRSGYSFSHTDGIGLADTTMITACVEALAEFHCALWRKQMSGDPGLCSIEPATIPRFVHRFGESAMRQRWDFTAENLGGLLKAWWDYFPILKIDAVVVAFRSIHAEWLSIRHRAHDIVMSSPTMIHGDFHFRNVAFGPKERSTWFEGMSRQSSLVMSPSLAMPHPEVEVFPLSPLRICAVDMQSFGGGHPALDLLYFMSTSLPVEILHAPAFAGELVESVSRSRASSVGVGNNSAPIDSPSGGSGLVEALTGWLPGRQSAGTSSTQSSGPPTESQHRWDSFSSNPTMMEEARNVLASRNEAAGRSPEGGAAPLSPGAASAVLPTSEAASGSTANPSGEATETPAFYKTFETLDHLRRFDRGIIAHYFNRLDPNTQRELGGIDSFERDVYTLAEDHAGIIMMDMAKSSVADRQRLMTTQTQLFRRLVIWSERTAARVILMVASWRGRPSAMK